VKKLHIFILKSFAGPLLMTFVICLVILLMQFLWRYLDDLVGKGLTAGTISELMLWASCSLVPMALPLAVLLASIMTFGNLGENYELQALKSAGISLTRIMFPLIIVSSFLTVFAFVFANNIMPIANLKMRSLLFDIQQSRPELQIREGIFYNGIENYSIKIGKKSGKENLLQNIYIYDHSSNKGNTSVTYADSGYIKVTQDKRYMLITLYNGHSYSDVETEKRSSRGKTYPFRQDRFQKQEMSIELSGFGLQRTDENLFKSNYQMMNLKQLDRSADSIRKLIRRENDDFKKTMKRSNIEQVYKSYKGPKSAADSLLADTTIVRTVNLDSVFNTLPEHEKFWAYSRALDDARENYQLAESHKIIQFNRQKRINKHNIEWHRKFTLSIACLIFFFIGAPFGAIVRKGGLGMPVVISIVFFVIYYIISLTGEKFVKESVMVSWEGMWISTVVLLPIGIYLTYKSTHDSSMLSLEAYINTIQKYLFPKAYKRKLAEKEMAEE
jgi:lipopolysaccharide export system permease protein